MRVDERYGSQVVISGGHTDPEYLPATCLGLAREFIDCIESGGRMNFPVVESEPEQEPEITMPWDDDVSRVLSSKIQESLTTEESSRM